MMMKQLQKLIDKGEFELTRGRMSLILILTILLTLACATTGGNPYVEVIVPESEKPAWFMLSPDRHKMLYKAGASYYVLSLDTGEKVNLTRLNPRLDAESFVRWVDNRYIYGRAHLQMPNWQELPRLVADTETWQVYRIEEFSPQKQVYIEQAWQSRDDQKSVEIFDNRTRYYSPNGQYYFVGLDGLTTDDKGAITIYTANGREVVKYQYQFISAAAWAHDSSGVYVLPSERVGWWSTLGKGIIKLRVSL